MNIEGLFNIKMNPKEELKEYTEEDMKAINDVAKGIIEKYKINIPKLKEVVFTANIDKNGFVSSLKHKTVTYKRSNILLNNKDKIEEYFNENYTEGISRGQFINVLRLFNKLSIPEETERADKAEREKEEATERAEKAEREKKEETERADKAEREKKEETERADKAERKGEEIHKAYTDNKDDYQQRLSDKTNEIKALTEENERLNKKIEKIEKAPLKREYINDKVFNESYSLDKGELMDVISKDINKGKLPSDTDPEEIADAIYAKATRRIYRNLKRINNLTALTGYNPDLYNKLPPEVAEIIKSYINEKIKDDIRRKNIKYILPKDKPRWEHAMESKQLNPMLGRSAWRVN